MNELRRLNKEQLEAINQHFITNIAPFLTNGPWEFNPENGNVVNNKGKLVCDLGKNSSQERDSNGELIMLSRLLIPLLLDTLNYGLQDENSN